MQALAPRRRRAQVAAQRAPSCLQRPLHARVAGTAHWRYWDESDPRAHCPYMRVFVPVASHRALPLRGSESAEEDRDASAMPPSRRLIVSVGTGRRRARSWRGDSKSDPPDGAT